MTCSWGIIDLVCALNINMARRTQDDSLSTAQAKTQCTNLGLWIHERSSWVLDFIYFASQICYEKRVRHSGMPRHGIVCAQSFCSWHELYILQIPFHDTLRLCWLAQDCNSSSAVLKAEDLFLIGYSDQDGSKSNHACRAMLCIRNTFFEPSMSNCRV